MNYKRLRVFAPLVLGMAASGQAQAFIARPPSGSITFEATMAALPVPVNETLALFVLAVALLLAGLWAVRRTSGAARMMSLILPASASVLLVALMVAPESLTARPAAEDPPRSYDVDGPGTIGFDFPDSEASGGFDPVTFWNRSGQSLKISDLETRCGGSVIVVAESSDADRGAPECAEGMELAPDNVCVVAVPECRLDEV